MSSYGGIKSLPSGQGLDIARMKWWEREKLLTATDKEAISEAEGKDWTEIDENAAETTAGRYELHRIITTKYHNEEFNAGIL